MPGGNLRLPPIRIEYADGSTQNLLLDVGGRRPETTVNSASFLTDLLLNRRSNVLSPVTSTGLGAARLRPLSGNGRSHLSHSLTSSMLSPATSQNRDIFRSPTALVRTRPQSGGSSDSQSAGSDRSHEINHNASRVGFNHEASTAGFNREASTARFNNEASTARFNNEASPSGSNHDSNSHGSNNETATTSRFNSEASTNHESIHEASTSTGERPATGLTQSSSANAASASDQAANGMNQTPASDAHTETSRNIILTVNYIYGQTPVNNQQGGNARTAGNEQNTDSQNGITGSLILHVPSINESNDDNLQVLVRLATIIALRTISTSIKKASGVPDKVFESFRVCKLEELAEEDRKCPICYDAYIEPAEVEKDGSVKERDAKESINSNGKRPMKDGKESQKKRRKSNADGQSSSYTSVLGDKESSKESSPAEDDKYVHVPVKMPCGHVFGRTCLHEWLKTNNSCPLCRDKIKHTRGSESGYATTVVLPNLAQVISDGREVIEDFNSRSLIFSMPDQEGNESVNGEQRSQEVAFPAAVPIRFPTIVTLNPLAANAGQGGAGANGAINTNGTGAGAGRRNGSPGVMRLVRELIQSLHNRLHQPVRLRDDQDATRDLQQGVLHRLPIIRPVVGNPTGASGSVDGTVPHVRMHLSPRSASYSAGSGTGANPPTTLFPVGVSSRRTPDGVVTTSIGGLDTRATNERTRDATDAVSSSSAALDSTHTTDETSQTGSSSEGQPHNGSEANQHGLNSDSGHGADH